MKDNMDDRTVFDYNDYYDEEAINEFDDSSYENDEFDNQYNEDGNINSDDFEGIEDFNDYDGEYTDEDLGDDDDFDDPLDEENINKRTSGSKKADKKQKVIPKSRRGEDVQKRFFAIMEDYHSGDPAREKYALECAVEELKGFIYSIIKKSYMTYARNNYRDLVNEGVIGVIEGMKKYDPSKSMPTTFFSPYIKHEMQLLITKQVDKTTAHYSTNIKKINKVIEQFEINDIPYTNVDIAIQTGLSLETVNQSMAIRNFRDEIHADSCQDGLIDANLKSRHMPTPEEDYIEKEEHDVLYKAIDDNLTPTEIKVLEMHFGLNGTETFSEGEIAKQLGIPKDKVKKHLNSSIRKLKESNLGKLYKDHLKHEQDLIEETEVAVIPTLTINKQLDIMSQMFDDEDDN